MKWGLGLIALAWAGSAQASSYWFVAETQTKANSAYLFFIDADTIVRRGDDVTFWLAQVNEGDAREDSGFAFSIIKSQLQCLRRTDTLLSVAEFSAKAAPLRANAQPVGPLTIMPGTPADSERLYACATSGHPSTAKSLLTDDFLSWADERFVRGR